MFVLAAAGVAFMLWRGRKQPAPAIPPPIARPTTPAPPPPLPPRAAPSPAAPAIAHPLGPAAAGEALPEVDGSDGFFRSALGELVGKKSVASFLMLDGFARRVVVTVNNLDGDTPAAQMWPVNRTPGRPLVDVGSAGSHLATGNAARYAAFVRFAESIDAARAAALYRRSYPLLQRAYEDLGFSGKYFNDRVVAVIDHLLATPDLPGPIAVKRAEVAGAPASGTAGGLYLFQDPALEARSAGQKILLRVGRDHAARLKAKLTEFRRLVAKGP